MMTRGVLVRMRRGSGVAAVAVMLTACSGTGGAGSTDGGVDGTLPDATPHHDGGVKKSGDSGSLTRGDASKDTGKTCTEGQACGDGGICAGGACCPSALACGSTCCAGGRVCSFDRCVKPGAACFDSSGCAANEYCPDPTVSGADAAVPDASVSDGGTCFGGALPQGVCLPAPPTCPGDAGVPDGGACIESCQYHPEAGVFTPVLKYAWVGALSVDRQPQRRHDGALGMDRR